MALLPQLKATEPGDRQAVWTGVHGNGIIGVVDFNGEVRPRSSSGRLYEGWGRITALPHPVSVERAQRHLVLGRCFSTSIQGVEAIDDEVGQAIARCADRLPLAATFEDAADWSQDGGRWSGERLAPEVITETLVRLKRFKAALRAAEVREVRFHDLRHTFGTRMAAQGVPMRTLQEMLGHRGFKTTLTPSTGSTSPRSPSTARSWPARCLHEHSS